MKTKQCVYYRHTGSKDVPVSNFGRLKTQPDGLHYYCKDCVNGYAKERVKKRSEQQIVRERKQRHDYYLKTREDFIQRTRTRNHRIRTTGVGLESVLVSAAKTRAKQKGLEFNITKDDIIIPRKCPVLGIELKCQQGGRHCDNSPSLDRIDPAFGYVKGNVIVVSFKANMIKSFGTPDEHLKIYKFYKKLMK